MSLAAFFYISPVPFASETGRSAMVVRLNLWEIPPLLLMDCF